SRGTKDVRIPFPPSGDTEILAYRTTAGWKLFAVDLSSTEFDLDDPIDPEQTTSLTALTFNAPHDKLFIDLGALPQVASGGRPLPTADFVYTLNLGDAHPAWLASAADSELLALQIADSRPHPIECIESDGCFTSSTVAVCAKPCPLQRV